LHFQTNRMWLVVFAITRWQRTSRSSLLAVGTERRAGFAVPRGA
jgi:hypothetical protein